MRCKKCGFDNPLQMKFCGQCANPLTVQCPKCNGENPGNFKFCGFCAADLTSSANTPLPSHGKTSTENDGANHHDTVCQDAERRQLTVLFCDLVGSSTLSEEIDPEDLRDIMREYRHTCDKVVQKFNGHVAQYLGDGILTYFGFPSAHEDDARRAVQTGLELIQAMDVLNQRLQQQNSDLNLAIRIGIHTGLVVVGEIGDGDKRSLALGETPNIAARLQNLATPNAIVISADTHRLTNGSFECVCMGDHELKGFSRPFTLFQVVKEETEHKIARKKAPRGQTPLIGREQESALLRDRLAQAKNGTGQVVLLSGEAGIGKSRLAQFVRDTSAEEPHFLFEMYGSPYYQNSYLYCAVQLMRRYLELDGKTHEEKVTELETVFGRYGLNTQELVPIFAEILAITIPEDRYPVVGFTPVQKKQKTLETFLTLGMSMAMQKPVVIIAEDLHWFDPTTLDLLGMFIDQVPTANIFLLLTYRMEFTPPWTPRSHITQISVNRLTRDQTAIMVKWLANNKTLPKELVTEIINKTDGTPLFVEELTSMVLNSELLMETEHHFQLASPLSSLSIPATLQDSLMARLDRLGPNKELAQLSATLGREFSYELLRAVSPPKETSFETRLAHLVYSELLYQHGVPPQASYTFRHALVHELAYQSLLKKTRQHYHHHIAQTLANQFPEIVEENPEIMAHHCTEAGDFKDAVRYWLQSGKTAIQRSANTDAVVHLKKALDTLKLLPESVMTAEYELAIQAALGLANTLSKGYAAPEVEKAYARAYSLCRMIGETQSTFPALCGLWEYYVVRAELTTAEELANQLLNIAKQTSDPVLTYEAKRAMGGTLFWRGQLESAYDYLNSGFESNAAGQAKRISTQTFVQDTEVANLSNTACVLWLLGYPDKALEKGKLAVQLAETLSHPFSLAYANTFYAFVYQLRGDYLSVKKEAEKILSISDTYEFSYWSTIGKMMHSMAHMILHQDNQYIIAFEEALQEYKNTGSNLALSYFQTLLAQSFSFAGRYSQAYDLIDDAIAQLEIHKEHFYQSELFRVKAEIILAADQLETSAEENLNKAISLAREQKARSLELRASTDLSRLWQSQGKLEPALSLLANALSQIKEGYKCKDWLSADILLSNLKDELSQSEQSELA
ncbi:adenylate/guanylate cyclase domain-containing protein [Kaarinaea lacus]